VDGHLVAADRGQHADRRGVDEPALLEHDGAGADVLAGLADEAAVANRHGDLDQLTPGRGPLDRHHGVGAWRERAAGHDPRGRARLHLRELGAAGEHLADHAKLRGRALIGVHHVGPAQREAVHRRVRERWKVLAGGDVRRQHAAERLAERHRAHGQRLEQLQHGRARLFEGDQVGRVGRHRREPRAHGLAAALSASATNLRRKSRKPGPRSGFSAASSTVARR
jgi:hypothetical protein